MRAGVTLAVLLGASSPSALAACNKAITVAETQQMDYSTIVVTSGGGTVTMAANGTVTVPGGVSLMGLPSAGSFYLTGTNNSTVTLRFFAGAFTSPRASTQ